MSVPKHHVALSDSASKFFWDSIFKLVRAVSAIMFIAQLHLIFQRYSNFALNLQISYFTVAYVGSLLHLKT